MLGAAREIAKYPEQTKFGFRVTGMNVFDPESEEADKDGYRIHDKHFGRSLKTEDDLKKAFMSFFTQTQKKLEEGGEGGGEGGAQGQGHLLPDRSQRRSGGVRNRILMEFRRQLKQVSE